GFLFLGFVSFTWIFWGFLIYYLIRVEHPFVSDAELDWKRKILGIFLLFSLAFIFVPVPMVSLAELKEHNLLEFLVYKMYSLGR
ncbi:MAG TPA: site-2 protease family protein, partial [Leptospiraceae bacterium]|nr:site-2 protease family protein [Leptospiraceae bacterium]